MIAGNNSSQPELVGDAGLLVEATDPHAVADALVQVLENHEWARRLRKEGLARSARFSWSDVAARALAAIRSEQLL